MVVAELGEDHEHPVILLQFQLHVLALRHFVRLALRLALQLRGQRARAPRRLLVAQRVRQVVHTAAREHRAVVDGLSRAGERDWRHGQRGGKPKRFQSHSFHWRFPLMSCARH